MNRPAMGIAELFVLALVIGAAGFAISAWRRSHPTEHAGSAYQKHVNGDVTTFEITPAPSIKSWYAIALGVFLCVLGLGALADEGFGPKTFFALLFAGFALWQGWARDPRPKLSCQPMSFRVSANSIESGGRTFMKDDIHRLILKNAMTDKELLAIYTTDNSVAQGMKWRAANAQVANTLNVEVGGRSTILAGGMDETTAYGLLRDVSKILRIE